MNKLLSSILVVSILSFGAVTAFADHHKGSETEKKEMTADTNNDGKVSYEEFKALRLKHMDAHFKRRDVNGDGFIDQAEKKAARENRKAHRKECKRKKNKENK